MDAVKECNDKKALEQDWFALSLLNEKDQGHNLRKKLVRMLNEDKVPNYLKASRLVMISKTNKKSAQLKDIRQIAVLSQLMKILEKAIKNKLESSGSKMFQSGNYQTGFKKGQSTSTNVSKFLNILQRGRRERTHRKIYIKIDLAKAYGNVDRRHLIEVLTKRAETEIQK